MQSLMALSKKQAKSKVPGKLFDQNVQSMILLKRIQIRSQQKLLRKSICRQRRRCRKSMFIK